MKPGKYLATTYSHRTYRPTTIGAEAFHFRVRNGTGWFRFALVTRGQSQGRAAGATRVWNWDSGDFAELLVSVFSFQEFPDHWPLITGHSFLPLSDIHMEFYSFFPISIRLKQSRSFGLSPIVWQRFRWNQADRMISTGKLNMLPHLHFQPINVVVFDDPSGKTHLGRSLALRCFQRLSLPHLATQPCR
jgi:hypothetical protein